MKYQNVSVYPKPLLAELRRQGFRRVLRCRSKHFGSKRSKVAKAWVEKHIPEFFPVVSKLLKRYPNIKG